MMAIKAILSYCLNGARQFIRRSNINLRHHMMLMVTDSDLKDPHYTFQDLLKGGEIRFWLLDVGHTLSRYSFYVVIRVTLVVEGAYTFKNSLSTEIHPHRISKQALIVAF